MTKTFPLMIFAAGKGTRMGVLTRNCPKPLVRVGGKPLIDHALDTIRNAPVSRVVVNTHYLGAMLEDHLRDHDVIISDESDALLETGGGLRKAGDLLGQDTVFTMNSDAVWDGPDPLTCLAQAWDPSRMDALLLLLKPDQALGHKGNGDFILAADGSLSRGPGMVYSGAQIVKTAPLNAIEEQAFSLNVLWNQYAEKGRLFGVHWSGKWCDVGQPESIPLAETILNTSDV
ncbi:nucleotidyltransferase family protein [Halocynthiibacter sp.]|uniref:nucleotidyltransferase family protein n=1 Tax=Halocynthiibacter sp. TaxID=1979210 RepID=UPI003C55E3E8